MCLLVLTIGLTAKKDKDMVIYGTYTSDADFSTKYWKEMFKGGGEGQPGNTLMAVGQGFVFKKAVLYETVEVGPGQYTTTYVKGDLMLNSSGPWLNKGKLRDTKIVAVNQSTKDGSGRLVFDLTFTGQFDNTGVFYQVTAHYDGTPEVKYDDYGNPVFQRDYEFDATIEIRDTAFPDMPDVDDVKKPKVIYGTYSSCDSDGGPHFNTKFWKEMFKGGGPGQIGNTLKALGDGFIFKQAKLDSIEPQGGDIFITTYVGGVLNLNSSGPWLNFGKLKAVNVVATNTSTFDNTTRILDFVIEFEGEFLDTGVHFKAVASYHGQPEIKFNDEDEMVFQRGSDFDVKIIIAPEPISSTLDPCNGN